VIVVGSVDSGGARITYEVTGPAGAPPLLLINSIGATRDVLWARQVPALSQTFRVVTYDPRGHGQSSSPPGDYTLDDLGRDAVAVLDALDIQRAHVCGISMGGITVLWLGIHAAARVDRIVAANTAARIGSLQSWGDRIALVRAEGLAGVAEQAMPRWFTEPFRQREPATIEQFRQMVATNSVTGYLGCCAALRDGDLRDALPRMTSPLLGIAGAEDMLTPPDALAFVRDQVKGATLLTLPCSHISNVEMAGEFNDAVMNFLART
jgi:3-oxoadipate enol-lactonase